ncbi:universal stress protein [Saccharopolyspora sp. MS10]|uniref:universal stress protein n=1 Tax=Saccharopolyspora sp. MS10 TaxID=3385973 RepID=UPI0039A1AF40
MRGAEIVVGVDGEPASRRALRWAVREARRRGSPLRVVMVWSSHAVLAGPGPLLMNPELAPHHAEREHRESLREVLAECTSGVPLDVRSELVEGRPAEVLAERSRSAELLVLGDHGKATMAESVLGSVALHAIRRAECPVVVVPHGVAEDALRADRGGPGLDPVLG